LSSIASPAAGSSGGGGLEVRVAAMAAARHGFAEQEFDLAVDAAELLLRPGLQLLVQRRVDA
jgi:hypothetical protein